MSLAVFKAPPYDSHVYLPLDVPSTQPLLQVNSTEDWALNWVPETGADWGDRVLQLAGVLHVPTSDFYTFTSYHVPGQSSVVLVGGVVVQAPEDP